MPGIEPGQQAAQADRLAPTALGAGLAATLGSEEGAILSATAQCWLAVFAVTTVFAAPMVLARPEERFLNLFIPLVFGTALIVLMIAIPFLLLAASAIRIWFGRWPMPSVLVIPLAVALVGTLPAMVGVHRALFEWHSYSSHMLPSIFSLVLISVFALARATVRPETRYQSLFQSLMVASAINVAFPWWPLD